MTGDVSGYADLLTQVKVRIRSAQVKASLAANVEMILLYWDIGRLIHQKQLAEGWGKKVIPRLSVEIRRAMPSVKGFSERNIRRMIFFYREYSDELGSSVFLEQGTQPLAIRPPLVAKLHNSFAPNGIIDFVTKIPWSHQVILMEGIKDKALRYWYMNQVWEQGWSRRKLSRMVKSRVHERQGKGVNNFKQRLATSQSDLAQEVLKDPYIFDFLTITEPFQERELELELTKHLEQFLVELGRGFSFVGRQHHLQVGGQDFYVDLLFYHLKLRCFVVVELKKGPFKPEYAGKVNFYCSVVDDIFKGDGDHPTIGLILCEENNRLLAEYALRGIHKPIGVSEFELTDSLPEQLKSSLPSIEEIEAELNQGRGS